MAKIKLLPKQTQALDVLQDGKTTEVVFGGSAGCFGIDTKVKCFGGYKEIQKINVGDLVYSLNESKDTIELKKVKNTFIHRTTSKNVYFSKLLNLRCTDDHKFFFRGEWTEIGELRRRAMEGSLFSLPNFKQGAYSSQELEGKPKGEFNEACNNRWLFKDNICNKRKAQAYSSSQGSIKSFSASRKSRQPYLQSQGFKQAKQLLRQSRVDDNGRKQATRSRARAHRLSLDKGNALRSKATFKGRENWHFKSNRANSKGNTCEVQTKSLHKGNACPRIWSKAFRGEGYNFKKVLEAREITIEEIKSFTSIGYTKEDVFDIEVEDNHNFMVTEQNIVVHNSAKSFLGCTWIIHNCFKYPETKWVIGRSKLKNLRQTTLQTLFEVLKIMEISSEHWNFNQQDNEIRFTNGSVILLKDLFLYPSDPNFDSLGSLEITGAFVDECNQITYKAWQILRSRIRYKLTEYDLIPKMLGTCNPSKNWVYANFYKADREGTISQDRCFIQALTRDNPHLHESYIQSLMNLDKNSRERLLFGNWEYDDDPAKLCEYDKILDLWSNEFVTGGQKYITADIAGRGSDKFRVYVWDGFKVVHIYSEAKSTGLGIINKINELATRFKVPNSNIVYDGDGVGMGLSGHIARAHEFINGSKPKGRENYNNLKSQCYFKLAEAINNAEIYIIPTEDKEAIIEELEQVKRDNVDKDGKLSILPKDKVKEVLGRSPDHSDALMMRFYFEVAGQVETFNADFF